MCRTKEEILKKFGWFLDHYDLSIIGCLCDHGSPVLEHNNKEGKVDWQVEHFEHTSHTKEEEQLHLVPTTRPCTTSDSCCAKRPKHNIHYLTHQIEVE